MVRASSPMVRTCKWLAGVWMLAVGTAAWGAPAADAPSGGASGIYRVTFSIRLGQPLPAGGAIVCRAHLSPQLGGAVVTATGMATVDGAMTTGSTARCTVEFPLRWEGGGGAAARVEGALNYEIDAVSRPGAQVYAVRAGQGIGVTFPAWNSNKSLQIYVLF